MATPLLDRQVFGDLIGTVARGFTWKQCWDASLASSFAVSCLGEQSSKEGGGLARAWTTRGPKVLSTNAAMKRRGCRGNSGHSTAILLRFGQISTIVHSVVFPTIYEKYIHTKIEANLLQSVAYKTLDIHVPLFNPLLHAVFYCKASN